MYADVHSPGVRPTPSAGAAARAGAKAERLKNLLPGVPLVESPFFDDIADDSGFDAETMRIGMELSTFGLAKFKFPDDDFDQRADRIRRDLASQFDLSPWRNNFPGAESSFRVQDAWTKHADVRAIAVNERVLQILGNLYGRRAWPFQTLNFPIGSQQHFHSDSVHFSSIPEKFMCGVWVALEDVDADSGPLVYYPGTHKWPIVYNDQIGVRMAGNQRDVSQNLYEDVWRALVAKHDIEPQYFHPKKGEALIWAANLLHGGAPHRDRSRTRWSQVTHYYFDDCCYVTPMMSDMMIGKLRLREMTDISTGQVVPNFYVDAPLLDLATAKLASTSPVASALPADFDPALYLRLNPDVEKAGADAATHFLRFGIRERRRYK